nr:MAG TPA: N-acetylmuramoyl-L-alanine amidase [Caudoviricetes sp.]
MDNIVWVGSPNHYNGRGGYHVTHITLHIMAGYLAGTDSVFANPTSQASAHYGIGADGTIHQYVSEADGSYSDANYVSNNSTISIEHEGGIPQAECTQACIDASARLCADIAQRYGLGKLWHDGTKGNVWLHREIAGTDHATCPDLAPNGLPYQQVIDKANAILDGKATTNNDNERNEIMAEMLFNNTDTGKVYYWNILTGVKYIGVPDQLEVLKAAGVPMHETSSKGPWMTRAQEITDNTLTRITATINAQAAAIKALSESMGANPDTLAQVVQDAVKAKLDSLKITVTDK